MDDDLHKELINSFNNSSCLYDFCGKGDNDEEFQIEINKLVNGVYDGGDISTIPINVTPDDNCEYNGCGETDDEEEKSVIEKFINIMEEEPAMTKSTIIIEEEPATAKSTNIMEEEPASFSGEKFVTEKSTNITEEEPTSFSGEKSANIMEEEPVNISGERLTPEKIGGEPITLGTIILVLGLIGTAVGTSVSIAVSTIGGIVKILTDLIGLGVTLTASTLGVMTMVYKTFKDEDESPVEFIKRISVETTNAGLTLPVVFEFVAKEIKNQKNLTPIIIKEAFNKAIIDLPKKPELKIELEKNIRYITDNEIKQLMSIDPNTETTKFEKILIPANVEGSADAKFIMETYKDVI
jgi:hypothetical protein